MKNFSFSAINLGCSKNLVDLEFIIGSIFNFDKKINTNFFVDPYDKNVEYVIINTCSFLSSSRIEAENIIKEFDDLGKKIIIVGCYVEVKNDIFLLSIKNLYAIIPNSDLKNLKNIFYSKIYLSKQNKLKEYLKNIGGNNINKKAFIWNSKDIRAYLNAGFGYEYLKISEGCDNNCTFCIIPNIRGRQKSRSIDDILEEVKIMINFNIKEIEIIAQDLTRYGTDLYLEPKLVDLLEKIDELPGNFKYRLFYMYPDNLTFDNLKRLKNLKKMLPYFDIPFQHISPKILKLMGRFYDENHIYKMLDFIKSNFKDAFIHTNFIVGFPGEDNEDFDKLKKFIEKYEFDSVSIFGYHDEKLANSYKLTNKIDDKIIMSRVKNLKNILNKIQKKKYFERIKLNQVGFIHNILGKNIHVRPELFAPEIDEYDIIKKENIINGNIGIGEKIIYKLKM